MHFGINAYIIDVIQRASDLYNDWILCRDVAKSVVEDPGLNNVSEEKLSIAQAHSDLFNTSLVSPMSDEQMRGVMNSFMSVCDCSKVINPSIVPNTLWWSGKSLSSIPSKQLLCDWFGGNEKTTITLLLAPESEPPIRQGRVVDEESYKNMLAFYHKRDHELKRLGEDNDDSYLESIWTDPKELKQTLNGVSAIKFK